MDDGSYDLQLDGLHEAKVVEHMEYRGTERP